MEVPEGGTVPVLEPYGPSGSGSGLSLPARVFRNRKRDYAQHYPRRLFDQAFGLPL